MTYGKNPNPKSYDKNPNPYGKNPNPKSYGKNPNPYGKNPHPYGKNPNPKSYSIDQSATPRIWLVIILLMRVKCFVSTRVIRSFPSYSKK